MKNRIKKIMGKEVDERSKYEEEEKHVKKIKNVGSESGKQLETVRSAAVMGDEDSESILNKPSGGVGFGGVTEVPAVEIPAQSPPASRLDADAARRRSVAFSEDGLDDQAKTPQGSQPQL